VIGNSLFVVQLVTNKNAATTIIIFNLIIATTINFGHKTTKKGESYCQ
jgi:hypothetical protein